MLSESVNIESLLESARTIVTWALGLLATMGSRAREAFWTDAPFWLRAVALLVGIVLALGAAWDVARRLGLVGKKPWWLR